MGSDYTVCVATVDETVFDCSDASFSIEAGTRDADGDGYDAGADCDDGDSSIHPGASESCDDVDNDCDGTIDDNYSCWVAIYRFIDPVSGAHCWNSSTSAPSTCSGYNLEVEAWIGRANSQANVWHAVQCSLSTDHIITEYGSADYYTLVSTGHNCSTVDLGYIYDLGSAPSSVAYYANTCPLYRFSGTTWTGGGEHLFSRGADTVSAYTCEPPARGDVMTNSACFTSAPSGC